MALPTATYRLQFNPEFGFADAAGLVPYLARLGISHVYASPLLGSRRGSEHGYDVTDPTRLDPELGGDDGFQRLAASLKAQGLRLLLDIVPNHMAAGAQNPWWVETLALGPRALHARAFDIDWSSGALVLPVLGKSLDEVLDDGDLELHFGRGLFWWRYHEQRFPLSPETAHALLAGRLDRVRTSLAEATEHDNGALNLPAYLASGRLPEDADLTACWHALRRVFAAGYEADGAVRDTFDAVVAEVNGYGADSQQRGHVERLLGGQWYRPVFWRTGLAQLNYRRFFDIASLAAVRVEDSEVFDWMHEYVLSLMRDGLVHGLRIDHVDGLANPTGYLHRLYKEVPSARGEDSPYIVVEKILSGNEPVPETWPVAGTTGYEFLNAVNGVLVHPEGYAALLHGYEASGNEPALDEIAYQRKREIIPKLFSAELERLTALLCELFEQVESEATASLQDVRTLLIELTACLPVYRTYFGDNGASSADPYNLKVAVQQVRERNPALSAELVDLLDRLILGHIRTEGESKHLQSEFVTRWQQFTGPAMAKGFEDTALYDWFPLVSLNDVGAAHDPGPIRLQTFHTWNTTRAGRYVGLNATSTHDTKRSEDVRARLNVLSEVAEDWEKALARWRSQNATLKMTIDGAPAPDPAFESFLYQNLLGIWEAERRTDTLSERMTAFAVKAARERKRETSWLDVNDSYEQALTTFTEGILNPPNNAAFLDDFDAFCAAIAPWGRLNSVAQALIKLAAPGVPDLYQGAEGFDFSLVDPDNRRPVDFARRQELLAEFAQRDTPPYAGLAWMTDPEAAERLRFWVTWRALQVRAEQPELFALGRYEGLYATDSLREHLLAFCRFRGDDWAVAMVPRFARSLNGAASPSGALPWSDSTVQLPSDAPGHWVNALTGESAACDASNRLALADCLSLLPFALFVPAKG